MLMRSSSTRSRGAEDSSSAMSLKPLIPTERCNAFSSFLQGGVAQTRVLSGAGLEAQIKWPGLHPRQPKLRRSCMSVPPPTHNGFVSQEMYTPICCCMCQQYRQYLAGLWARHRHGDVGLDLKGVRGAG